MQLARHYQTVRQPGRMRGDSMEGQKLIFLYPFAIDQSLGKHMNRCRDFFTVSFINEIKIENILNIVSSANTNVGSIGSGNNKVNPAELVYQMTQQRSNIADDLNTQPESDPYFYKEKIEKFNQFLQIQLKKDPRYQKFRPVFSTITLNQMLDVPLIIGSKALPIDSQYMYLLLMISIIYEIPWDSDTNVRRAQTILKGLEPGQFSKLIVSQDFRNQIEYVANIKGQTDNLNSGDSEAIRTHKRINSYINSQSQLGDIFFGMILNKTKWESNFPEMTIGSNLSFNTVSISTRTQRRHYEQSIGALSGYVAEFIVPILHSFEIFTGPVDASINVPEKIDSFVSDFIDGMSDDFVNLSNNINQGLMNINAADSTNVSGDVGVTTSNIEQMAELCEDNAKLSAHVKELLKNLKYNSKLDIAFNSRDLMKFVEQMTTAGNQFHSFGEAVDDWLLFISQNGTTQLSNTLRTIQNRIDMLINELLYEEYPNGHGKWVEPLPIGQFTYRHQNYCSAFGIDDNSGQKTKQYAYFKQSVVEVQTALREMLIFFTKWVFFSYSCSYLKDIEMDVEIQKRDALEFPNFCLVLPYKLFRDLYATQVSQNFKKYMNSNDEDELDRLSSRGISTFNPNDMGSLFRVVHDQLKIPNLIVIDEQTKKCHYQFMYMLKPVSINMTTMDNFIKHQNDVLPGF